MKNETSKIEEWIILKKKYREHQGGTINASFLTSTLQRTKNNLSKFSNAFNIKDKDPVSNKSIASNYSILLREFFVALYYVHL
jgi:hypothetical protein